jgi:hypothetical protein
MATTPAVNPFRNNYGRNQGGNVGVHGNAGATFKLRWNGDAVQRTDAIMKEAFTGLQSEALQAARQFQQGHIVTRDLVDNLYAEVVAEQGRRLTLAIGSTSEHTIYEELGTRFRPGHPNLRRALDFMVPRLKTALSEAWSRNGSRT